MADPAGKEKRVIGPALPPWLSSRAGESGDSIPEEPAREFTPEPSKDPPAKSSKRFIGPEIPPVEVLAAAHQSTDYGPQIEEEEDFFPFIGPIPPETVDEANNASESERFKEVERIITPELNEYEVLGVNQTSASSEIKKRYMKLSLLVHPDKCSHSKAKLAFSTLNEAFKTLQNEEKRAAVDRSIEQKREREEYEKELKQLRDAAEWRRLRGESLPGDEEILNGKKRNEEVRDSWMKELPPERQARVVQSNTFFSKMEKTGRGDTSAWTDTPMERAQKSAQKYLQNTSHLMLESSAIENEEILKRRNEENIALIDAYNEKKRKKSLLETHQENLYGRSKKSKEKKEKKDRERKERKKERKEKEETRSKHRSRKSKASKSSEEEESEGSSGSDSDKNKTKIANKIGDEDWKGKHPWKPWNREEDLLKPRSSMKLDKNSLSAGLSSRFGSSNSERKFL